MKMSKLLALALVLLISVGTLAGSTIAWFTDEVTSGSNILKSGTLDAEMWYKDEAGTLKDASEGAIFNYQNWEPGFTQVKELTLKNVGSLAFEYELNVLNAAVEGEYKLADVIEVYYGSGATPTSLTEVKAGTAAGTITNPIQKASGILLPAADKGAENAVLPEGANAATGEATMWIALHMQEEAGNEYQGLSVGDGFAVQMLAKQYTYEKDSFDNQYDVNADYSENVWDGTNNGSVPEADEAGVITISTADELAALAVSVNGGKSYMNKTIKLANNINLASREWTPIGTWDTPFSGTFDGQDYTISNLYINNPEGEEVGLFGCTKNATIKGIKVENVDIIGYSRVAAIVGYPYSGCSISNCHVSGDINIVANYAYVGGIAGNGYVDIDNCSVIAEDKGIIKAVEMNTVGGIVGRTEEGDNRITNCHAENLDLTGWANIGAITGFVHYSNVIDGCSAKNITLTKTRVDGIASIGMAAGGWSYNASKAITITNNSFKNITLNGSYVYNSAADILYGSEYGGNLNRNFVLSNNTPENITNNLVEVVAVKTADALKNALAGEKTVVLSNDLDLDADETITIPNGHKVGIALNGKTITTTSDGTGANRNAFDVRGELTVEGGTITTEHKGTNMAWNNSTNVFNVTDGGVLTIKDATIENLGGSDMAFGVHLNNWGEVTLNVYNSTIKSTYMAVRVFNSGNNMNNVTIKNSTLEGKYCLWVHNYSLTDFKGDTANQAAHAALLNFEIFGNGNTFNCSGKAPVLYGFDDEIYFDANGTQVNV